ncbi:MAG: DUF433 domain-containing protein [Chloroflexi bacterium]|nr:DUF433 domain-containing protein [Chloroflexota bacterium]
MSSYRFIQTDPDILGGKPHIKGTRLSVAFILELFASGASREDILSAYPQLTSQAVEEALHYAAESVENEIVFSDKIAA